jgi:hypothetical protein
VGPLAAALVGALASARGADGDGDDDVAGDGDDDVAEWRLQLLYAAANAGAGGEAAKNALVAAGAPAELAAALRRGPPRARVAAAWCATNLAWTCPPHAPPADAVLAAGVRCAALAAAGVDAALHAAAQGAADAPPAAADDARVRARAALEQIGRAAAAAALEREAAAAADAHMQDA